MAKFVLTGALKGKTVVLGSDQYPFVDGVFECTDDDAHKIAKILCQYYQAELIINEAQEANLVATTKSDGTQKASEAMSKK